MPFALHASAASGLNMRAATEADLPFLCKLYGSTRTDELMRTGWSEATKSLFVIQQFSAQHGEYAQRFPDIERLIVERDGVPIGRCYVSLSGDSCHLIDIALMPGARGQGYGSLLLSDLKSCAAAMRKPVTLSVVPDNPARRLYARLGFMTTQTTASRVRMGWQPPG